MKLFCLLSRTSQLIGLNLRESKLLKALIVQATYEITTIAELHLTKDDTITGMLHLQDGKTM